nr:MAG TPA: hypothetical protein [Caudoviricetes sp.]
MCENKPVLHGLPLQSKYLHVQSIARCKTLYNTVGVQSFVREKGEA